MSLPLRLAHYRELLEAAKTGGYDWASFDRHPRPRDLFLRHDVDLSLEAALEMARVEHELGVRATYFLMTESAFYNLDSHVGHYAQRQLRQWGHAVGLHAIHPRAELDRRFDKVLAWHNPAPEYMTQPVFGAVNVMEPPYFTQGHYRSDSNAHWREGCPARRAARGRVRVAPAARAPGDLGLRRRDDARDDARDARREAQRVARLSRQRQDRPGRMTTILVTASGAPGTAALLRGLRENGEREVRLVGVDMAERSIGRHLCDAFHRVPAGSDPGYADTVLEIVERERVDVVLPQSSFDLPGLAAARERFPVPVLVSSAETVQRSNDKAETYSLLQRIGVPTIEFRRVAGGRQVEQAARELGYPERPVCFKPVFSSGSRGFRILDPSVDRAHQLLHERPGSVAMRLEEALELLPETGGTELLVMELASGGERTIDGIADGERIVLGHPKTREAMRAGLAMYFVTLDEPELMEIAERIVRELHIEWFFNIQLVGGQVIEVNPRISTIVYQEDLNLPWLGVKRALGEISDDELASLRERVRPGRTALRYFDQVEWDADAGSATRFPRVLRLCSAERTPAEPASSSLAWAIGCAARAMVASPSPPASVRRRRTRLRLRSPPAWAW